MLNCVYVQSPTTHTMHTVANNKFFTKITIIIIAKIIEPCIFCFVICSSEYTYAQNQRYYIEWFNDSI